MLGAAKPRPHIVALVGPPGCGKTTTLVKLAVNYGLASRRPVLLLSMDTYRVAAAEQLRSYAAILGVGVSSARDRHGAGAGHRGEPGQGTDLHRHARVRLRRPGRRGGPGAVSLDAAGHRHATGPAGLHEGRRPGAVVDSFEIFRPQRLLFTKLDETSSFGPIVNESARTGKPVSFLATGQRIPEDLETASAADWLRSFCRSAPPAAGARLRSTT